MTQVRRLFVLLCGFEILPKTISTRDRGGRFILAEPVSAYLLDTAQGWVLLDAAINPDHTATPEARKARFEDLGMTAPVVQDQHRLERQLEQIGIGLSDISWVILSHLHYDHCGYLSRLTHARVTVQRDEYKHAMATAHPVYFRDDYDRADIRWHFVDGDWQALPGLEWFDTRGHTAGQQSALVTLPSGERYILPFDAADLAENLSEEVIPGNAVDDAAALRAIRRIKQLQAQTGAHVLLFHDPVAIQQMKLAPDFYA